MPTALNTTFDLILQSAKTKLINDNVFTSANCFIAVNKDVNVFPPGTYCVLSPGYQQVDQPLRAGSGRLVTLIHAEMHTTLWKSINLDQNPRDEVWLTDMSIGMIQLQNAAVNSLELYQPLDTQGNWLSPIGFQLKDVQTYECDKGKINWCSIKSRWNIEFTLSILPSPTP